MSRPRRPFCFARYGGKPTGSPMLRCRAHDMLHDRASVPAPVNLMGQGDVTMRAMLIKECGSVSDGRAPLVAADWPAPVPGVGEILIRVSVCGVCHTELDEVEGRMPPPHLPVIPGHQVVGRVEAMGEGAGLFGVGDRVGVAWIFSACGRCGFCKRGDENLCDGFQATGRDANGGYAELMTVSQDFAHAIPDELGDSQAAPLLCAGAIGFRSLRLAGLKDGQSLGLTGFGASAHLVLKLVRHSFPKTQVFVFARSTVEQAFARELGATWAGDTADRPRAGSTRSSIPRRRGLPLSRLSRIWKKGAGWSSTRSARSTPTKTPCWGSTTPHTSGSKRKSRASPTSRGPT